MRATGSEAEARITATEPTGAPCFVIEHVAPTIDGGRYPLKRILGEACPVEVDILRDGHDVLAGRILFRGPGDADWRHAPLTYDYGRDVWHGAFAPDRLGRWTYTVEAWTAGRCSAVFDRWLLRAWLSAPTGLYGFDNVTWARSGTGVALTVEHAFPWWILAPRDLDRAKRRSDRRGGCR